MAPKICRPGSCTSPANVMRGIGVDDFRRPVRPAVGRASASQVPVGMSRDGVEPGGRGLTGSGGRLDGVGQVHTRSTPRTADDIVVFYRVITGHMVVKIMNSRPLH